jgi:hypothetical protein
MNISAQNAVSEESNAAHESWKAEYEAQVESWRAQSAEARVKAEKERERWEKIRAQERAEGKHSTETESGWEKVGQKSSGMRSRLLCGSTIHTFVSSYLESWPFGSETCQSAVRIEYILSSL